MASMHARSLNPRRRLSSCNTLILLMSRTWRRRCPLEAHTHSDDRWRRIYTLPRLQLKYVKQKKKKQNKSRRKSLAGTAQLRDWRNRRFSMQAIKRREDEHKTPRGEEGPLKTAFSFHSIFHSAPSARVPATHTARLFSCKLCNIFQSIFFPLCSSRDLYISRVPLFFLRNFHPCDCARLFDAQAGNSFFSQSVHALLRWCRA